MESADTTGLPARVLVNPAANGGRAGRAWAKVEAALRARGVAFEVTLTTSAEDAARAAREAVAAGCRTLIAAGGDGSVNGLLNALMDPARDAPVADVALGAIGLGSSNDFHKPLRDDRRVGRVPVRLIPGERRVDVGKAVFTDEAGATRTRYFLLGASVGLVAEGNAYFNRRDPFLAWLKRVHVEVAILYTALVNLLVYRPVRVRLWLDGGEERRHEVTNVSVIKRVHLSGGMRYDTPVLEDDGRFDVNLLDRMGRLGIVRAIASLYRGRFLALAAAHHARAARVRLVPDGPAALELDGEVWPAVEAELSVVSRALRLCT